MSEYLSSVKAAEQEVRAARKQLNQAEKNKKNQIRDLSRNLQDAENHISQPLKSFAGIDLYLNHIDFQNRTYALNEYTKAEVSTSGAVYMTMTSKGRTGISVGGALIGGAIAGPLGAVVGGVTRKNDIRSEKHDERSVYLNVETNDGVFVSEVKVSDEGKARTFAADILTAAKNVEWEYDRALRAIETARTDLDTARRDHQEIDACTAVLKDKEDALQYLIDTASSEEKAALTKRNQDRRKGMILGGITAVILLLGIFGVLLHRKPAAPEPPVSQPVAANRQTESRKQEETKETTKEENKEEVTEEAPPVPEEPAQEAPADGIRPEFREAMESYEAFFDEYVSFMQSVNEGNTSTETLLKYYEYLAKYEDMMNKLDAIDESELSYEEDLLYLDTLNRINQKLLEAAQ